MKKGRLLASAGLLELGHVRADDGGAEELEAGKHRRVSAIGVLDENLRRRRRRRSKKKEAHSKEKVIRQ